MSVPLLTSTRLRAASVSRNLTAVSLPRLSHSLSDLGNSVLSLCADADHIYSGSQCPDISVRFQCFFETLGADGTSSQVWDKKSFACKASLLGHSSSVLALEYAEDKRWLFSSSGMFR